MKQLFFGVVFAEQEHESFSPYLPEVFDAPLTDIERVYIYELTEIEAHTLPMPLSASNETVSVQTFTDELGKKWFLNGDGRGADLITPALPCGLIHEDLLEANKYEKPFHKAVYGFNTLGFCPIVYPLLDFYKMLFLRIADPARFSCKGFDNPVILKKTQCLIEKAYAAKFGTDIAQEVIHQTQFIY